MVEGGNFLEKNKGDERKIVFGRLNGKGNAMEREI